MSGNIYGSGDRGKATRLHAELVRSRGFCEHCGQVPDLLECAHIVSRRYASTRTDERNAFCLCSGCHRYFTEWPLEFSAFVVEMIGAEDYDALKKRAQQVKKVDWPAEVERLKALLAEVDA